MGALKKCRGHIVANRTKKYEINAIPVCLTNSEKPEKPIFRATLFHFFFKLARDTVPSSRMNVQYVICHK